MTDEIFRADIITAVRARDSASAATIPHTNDGALRRASMNLDKSISGEPAAAIAVTLKPCPKVPLTDFGLRVN